MAFKGWLHSALCSSFRSIHNFIQKHSGERCTNGKKSKERITVLVGANMTGTEKLPLLVIGKSLKPRCFKNASVPVQYTANRKAWMTSAVFETWLKRWDNVLVKDKRKVLLYIDNCSAHPPRLTLSSITIKFFPPNTTAISQVCIPLICTNGRCAVEKLATRGESNPRPPPPLSWRTL